MGSVWALQYEARGGGSSRRRSRSGARTGVVRACLLLWALIWATAGGRPWRGSWLAGCGMARVFWAWVPASDPRQPNEQEIVHYLDGLAPSYY